MFFGHTEIVKEKNPEAYASLVERRYMQKAKTWMVGNSPKSDINPALSIGLNAVFVPHANTWVLEKEEIRNGGGEKLLVLEEFGKLREHF